MIERKAFFAAVRKNLFGGALSRLQVDGMSRILDEWERRQLADPRFLAYMLATVFWETAKTMQPIRERGGEKYLRSKKYYPWVGEGLVQTTWEGNHRKFGATAPGQLMEWPACLVPLFDGMLKGMFTTRALKHYFNATADDPIGARKIINGTDKAREIAKIYSKFLGAITSALVAGKARQPAPTPEPVAPQAPKPPSPAAPPAKTAAGPVGVAVAGGGALAAAFSAFSGHPWLVAGAAALICGGAFLIYRSWRK
jgi:hypothetical protein